MRVLYDIRALFHHDTIACNYSCWRKEGLLHCVAFALSVRRCKSTEDHGGAGAEKCVCVCVCTIQCVNIVPVAEKFGGLWVALLQPALHGGTGRPY